MFETKFVYSYVSIQNTKYLAAQRVGLPISSLVVQYVVLHLGEIIPSISLVCGMIWLSVFSLVYI